MEVGGQRQAPADLPARKRPGTHGAGDLVVWADAENLALNGIRSPDRLTRSELLYRLMFQTGSRVFHKGRRSPDVLYVHGANRQFIDTAAP